MQASSSGNWRLKSLIVYRKCFGIVCLRFIMNRRISKLLT